MCVFLSLMGTATAQISSLSFCKLQESMQPYCNLFLLPLFIFINSCAQLLPATANCAARRGSGQRPKDVLKDVELCYVSTMNLEVFNRVSCTPTSAKCNFILSVVLSQQVIYFIKVKPLSIPTEPSPWLHTCILCILLG